VEDASVLDDFYRINKDHPPTTCAGRPRIGASRTRPRAR
jgi:myosin-crossreactive antigen